MTVSYVGTSAAVDSGGTPVTSINVDRTALTLNVGDYCLIWGWVNTTVDWDIPDGADGNPWTKLWKFDRFQVWGKFLGSGFGTTATGVNFSGGKVVFRMEQAFYRGAAGLSWVGAVTGTGRNSFQAPAAFPTGSSGKVARLWAMSQPPGDTLAVSFVPTPGYNFRTYDGSSPPPALLFMLADTPYSGSGNVGVAAATVNPTVGDRRFTLANALTVIFNANQRPNIPALVSPPDLISLDPSLVQRFTWTYSDPDGDPQDAFDYRYRDLSTGGWTTISRHSTAGTHTDIPAGTFTDGHDYAWQVRTYDTHGAVSDWPAERLFTASATPDIPTIDYPTSGGTVTRVDRVDWTFTSQQDWEVRRVADDIDGNPDTGTIYEDFTSTDSTDATDTRTFPLTFTVNGRYEHIQVRCKLSGLWSDWADVRIFVSYVEPPVADLQVLEGDDGASIALVYATPAADPGITDQPDATSVQLDYSTDRGATFTTYRTGLPISGTDLYGGKDALSAGGPCSGLDYVFRVRAFADNGTASTTEWISRARLTVDEVV